MTARATTATPHPAAKVSDALHQQNCLPAYLPAAGLGGGDQPLCSCQDSLAGMFLCKALLSVAQPAGIACKQPSPAIVVILMLR